MTDAHPFHAELPPHAVALRRFALRLTHHDARADDLVQETFLKAWTCRLQFSPGTDLRRWLFTILRNAFYSDLRKHRREVEDVDGKMAARLHEEAAQDHAVELNELIGAIARLPEIYRRPLVLMGAYGFSQMEAADACGCTVGTIKSRVSRGRSNLSQAFGRESPDAMAGHPRLPPLAALPVARRLAPKPANGVPPPWQGFAMSANAD
jgi:RNA polymerase sigma-70 factor, ECF subfamily